MAKMYPSNIEIYNYTESEKIFFNACKTQLPDNYSVFYSLSWFDKKNDLKIHSECDFLIFNPSYGYLTVEVKGGKKIEIRENDWLLYTSEKEYRTLRMSPFKQAELSMYYFKENYEKNTEQSFNGIFGCAVAFPFYEVNASFLKEASDDLIINGKDMKNLEKKISEVFHYWRGKNKNFVFFSDVQKNKFINIVKRQISLNAATGNLIELKEKQMEITNRVQINLLNLISNYNEALIYGAAGTGKTWMGIKKLNSSPAGDSKQLYLCYNNKLMTYVRSQVNEENIVVLTFHSHMRSILGKRYDEIYANNQDLNGIFDEIDKHEYEKYDSIVVDEGQDFTEEWAMTVRKLLKKDNSDLYVFCDPNQNIYNRDLANNFMIETPIFVLKENLRNTVNIHNWACKKAEIVVDSYSNLIEGGEPILILEKNKNIVNMVNKLLIKLIEDEGVKPESIVILSNRKKQNSILSDFKTLGSYKIFDFDNGINIPKNEIGFSTVHSFKGLESDLVIYLEYKTGEFADRYMRYVAYTRAKYFLYVFEISE